MYDDLCSLWTWHNLDSMREGRDPVDMWACLWGVFLVGLMEVGRPMLHMGDAISWAEPWTERGEGGLSTSLCVFFTLHYWWWTICDPLPQAPAAVTSLLGWTVTWNCEPKQTPSPWSWFCQGVCHRKETKMTCLACFNMVTHFRLLGLKLCFRTGEKKSLLFK